jgi:hypothetical protein
VTDELRQQGFSLLAPARSRTHSQPNRVDHFDKGKPREIARADARDPVFPHEDGGVRVVKEVWGQSKNWVSLLGNCRPVFRAGTKAESALRVLINEKEVTTAMFPSHSVALSRESQHFRCHWSAVFGTASMRRGMALPSAPAQAHMGNVSVWKS